MKKNDVVTFIGIALLALLLFFSAFAVINIVTDADLRQQITAIKNRLTINITQPGFTNPIPECDFHEVRQQLSDEYRQLTVNYQVFQNGKGSHGDIEAFVEIYNVANETYVSTDKFIVEVARNCWNELTVYLDGEVVTVFPTVTDNVLSYGYITFSVST